MWPLGSQHAKAISRGSSPASNAVTNCSKGALDTQRPVCTVHQTPPVAGSLSPEAVTRKRYQPSAGAVVQGSRP